jgi:hypothetical protein
MGFSSFNFKVRNIDNYLDKIDKNDKNDLHILKNKICTS